MSESRIRRTVTDSFRHEISTMFGYVHPLCILFNGKSFWVVSLLDRLYFRPRNRCGAGHRTGRSAGRSAGEPSRRTHPNCWYTGSNGPGKVSDNDRSGCFQAGRGCFQQLRLRRTTIRCLRGNGVRRPARCDDRGTGPCPQTGTAQM